jgi:hypothetical protein
MAITQKFYPSFFQTVLNETLFVENKFSCNIALFKAGAEFDKEHTLLSDVDPVALGISSTLKTLEVTLELDLINEKLNFPVPEITWESSPGEDFYHGIIWGDEGILFMHFDFGGAQNPAGGFKLTPNELCTPHINLSYASGCP